MADFQTFDLAKIYGAADESNARQLQNQVIQNQFARQQKQDTEDDAVKGAYKFNGDGTLDAAGTYANLAKVSPSKAYEFQTATTKSNQEAARIKREDNTAKLDDAGKVGKLMGDSAKNVLANPTLQNAVMTTQRFGHITGQDVSEELQNLQAIGDNPDGLRKWAAGHALTAEQLLPKTQMQDTGGTSNVLSLDPLTGKPTVISSTAKTATPGEIMSNKIAQGNLGVSQARLGEERRHNSVQEQNSAVDPAAIESTAAAIANGQLAPLSGFALKSPGAQRIMARALEINPQLSAIDYASGLKASKDFGSGKLGSNVRSINVTMGHLDTLGQLTDALGNGNMQAFNKLGNYYATQTGQTAPTNFAAAKQIIGDEIVKSIVGTGGGVHDRELAQKALDAANSPAQLAGVAKTYKALLSDQLKGFEGQYKASTGKGDFQQKYLNDASRNLENNNPEKSNPLSVTAPNGKVYQFKSQAQANEFKRQAGIK